MVRRSLLSPLALFCTGLLLAGCTTTTRVPLITAIPPVAAGREGPDRKIIGYTDADGAYRRHYGLVRAVGADSVCLRGGDTLWASTPDPAWPAPARPERLLVLPRSGVGYVAIERDRPLVIWAVTIVTVGGLITLYAVTTDEPFLF